MSIIAVLTLCAGFLETHAVTNVITAFNAPRKIIPGTKADAYGRTGTSVNDHGAPILRGYYTSASASSFPVLVFVLPDLAGGKVVSANLTVYGTKNMAHNAYNSALDLYGVRYQAETGAKTDTEVLSSDAATGKEYAPSNNGTGIMDNMFPPSKPEAADGFYSTDSAAQVALGNWLKAQYDAGAKAGDYVFLRLTPDTADASIFGRGWLVSSADAPVNQPVLQITTVSP